MHIAVLASGSGTLLDAILSAELPVVATLVDRRCAAQQVSSRHGVECVLVERTDLRVAAETAIFEVSEAKRWLLGGYNHGHLANVSFPIAMEMALGFRFTAQRFYEIGFLNRVVPADELMPSALAMAGHLLTLPPAARVNTVHMMRQMRPEPNADQQRLAAALHDHGAKSDLMESRAAFAEKRKPNFKGWNDPADRYRLPTIASVTRK